MVVAAADRPSGAGVELLGRDREISALLEAMKRARHAGPLAIVIDGEAGIGKSALWSAGLETARDEGAALLIHRAVVSESVWAFGGLGDLLGPPLPSIAQDLPGPRRRAIESALLLVEPVSEQFSARAIGLGVLDVLNLLSDVGPVVIAIDDAHWLDASTGHVLGFALRRLRSAPVALLVTVRSPTNDPTPLLAQIGDALPVERIHAGPLSMVAMRGLVRARTGLELRRHEAERLTEVTRGNPLFALEVAREVARRARPLDPTAPLPVPDDLDALLRGRLRRLDPATRAVLATAAALSRATRVTLATIYGLGPTTRALAEADDAGIARSHGETLRFEHPLFASVLLDTLGDAELRAIHGRIAAAAADPEERARHLALSGSRTTETADALDAAAARAMARGATEAAGELAELAACLGAPDDPVARARKLKAADAYRLAGDRERARDLLQPILREPGLDPAIRAEILFALARGRRDPLPRVAGLTEEALSCLGPDDPRATDMLVFLSWIRLLLGRIQEGLAAARLALNLAERLGDPVHLARAIARTAQAEMLAVDVSPGLLDRGVELEARLRTQTGIVLEFHENPAITLTQRLMRTGAFDEARRLLHLQVAGAIERGDEGTHGHLRFHLIQLEGYAGRYPEALAHADIAMELAEQLEDPQFRGLVLATTARIHAHLGESEHALQLADEALAMARTVGDALFEIDALSVTGFVQLSDGLVAAAAATAGELPARLLELGYRDPCHQAWAPSIESLIGAGHLARARPLLDQWSATAALTGSPRALGPAARSTALLRAAEGDHDAALGWYARAVAEFERYPTPFEIARTRLYRGITLRALRRRSEARAELEAASAALAAIGASTWASRANREAARIGGRRPSGAALTPTQRQVVDGVLAARSNKEIAAGLGLTVNTVESHLTNIYRTLGVETRLELVQRTSAANGSAAEGRPGHFTGSSGIDPGHAEP